MRFANKPLEATMSWNGRPANCRKCHGDTIRCDTCKGNGKVQWMFGDCTVCDGTGHVCPSDGKYWK
jgi:hypothetical protein